MVKIYEKYYYNNQYYQREYSHNSHSSTIKPYVEAKITSSNLILNIKTTYLWEFIIYIVKLVNIT